MWHQDTVLTAALGLFAAGCFDDFQLTGDGDGTTGDPNDGVYINCLNINHLNSWWQFGPGGVPVQLFGAYPELAHSTHASVHPTWE